MGRLRLVMAEGGECIRGNALRVFESRMVAFVVAIAAAIIIIIITIIITIINNNNNNSSSSGGGGGGGSMPLPAKTPRLRVQCMMARDKSACLFLVFHTGVRLHLIYRKDNKLL